MSYCHFLSSEVWLYLLVVSSVSKNVAPYLLYQKCPTVTYFFRGLVVSKSLGVGGRLLSSLLSAYLGIWPDTHCEEGESDDQQKTFVQEEKNERDLGEKESGGEKFIGKKHEEQTTTTMKKVQTESCETEGAGKIQCGRSAE